jgi:hypothetical protein
MVAVANWRLARGVRRGRRQEGVEGAGGVEVGRSSLALCCFAFSRRGGYFVSGRLRVAAACSEIATLAAAWTHGCNRLFTSHRR